MPECVAGASHGARRDRGVVLILVMMLAFGILAIAALVIDLGFAFLAQDQMQSATDSAALEGLRFRDEADDATRRARALGLVGAVFDDDLDADPLDPDALRFGAGPILALTGGVGTTNALALLEVPDLSVYKPNAEGIPMELNLGNAAHGDLVAGTYDPGAAHVEAADYARLDFDPFAPDDAFLARLRRSNDTLGLDRVAGESSAGPTLPFLFGLGTAIHAAPGGTYNPRTDGITVRATSIAAARRALHASGGPPAVGALPLAPIVIREAIWNGAAPGGVIDVLASGGSFAHAHHVGQPALAAPAQAIASGAYLVPIVEDVAASAVPRVIGFGSAMLQASGSAPAVLLATVQPGRVLRAGVDARHRDALLALAADAGLGAAHAQLQHAVLAAVLVR